MTSIESLCNVAIDVLEEIGHIFVSKNKLTPSTRCLSLSMEVFSSDSIDPDENFSMSFKVYDGFRYTKFDKLDDALSYLKGDKIE